MGKVQIKLKHNNYSKIGNVNVAYRLRKRLRSYLGKDKEELEDYVGALLALH